MPEHTGSGPITGPVMVNAAPHELFTAGGLGTTWASVIQGTVELPLAGKLNVGGLTV